MKVNMTSAKFKIFGSGDAELVSSGLESGPMPILLCKLCTHWAISSALYIIHLVQWWKRQKEVGTKSFRQMMMTTVHCLQLHTWRSIFLHLLNPFFILALLWVTWHTFWIGIGNMRIGQDLVCQKVKKNIVIILNFQIELNSFSMDLNFYTTSK